MKNQIFYYKALVSFLHHKKFSIEQGEVLSQVALILKSILNENHKINIDCFPFLYLWKYT